MLVRPMRAAELDQAVSVWHAANAARGRRPDTTRVARVREKLAEPSASPYVADDGHVVGMALAEPGRAHDGAGAVVPGWLHVSMVFVHPSAQRRGVGAALMRHVLDAAGTRGATRVSLWTAADNEPARRLYEHVGMTAIQTRQVTRTIEWIQYARAVTDLREGSPRARPVTPPGRRAT